MLVTCVVGQEQQLGMCVAGHLVLPAPGSDSGVLRCRDRVPRTPIGVTVELHMGVQDTMRASEAGQHIRRGLCGWTP